MLCFSDKTRRGERSVDAESYFEGQDCGSEGQSDKV